MIKKIKRLIWATVNYLGIGGAIQLLLKSSLKEDGWFHSFHAKQSIDASGNPLPWFTYPFIKFIEPRLKKDFNVYEYGSGNSTLWFSKRVQQISSIEHDEIWFQKINKNIPSNVKLNYKSVEMGSAYEDDILSSSKPYDIIVIDGRKRVKCTLNSLKKISDEGVIIFDNSERPEYKEALELLEKSFFKKIDFWGIGPIIHCATCTTVYYRANNCLGI